MATALDGGVSAMRFVAALCALSLLMMGAYSACDRKVPSDRPPQDRQVDPKYRRTVTIRVVVERQYAPYTIEVKVRDAKGASERWPTKPGDRLPVPSGEYRQEVHYTSGVWLHVEVNAELKTRIRPGADDRGERNFCSIEDGPAHTVKVPFLDDYCLATLNTVR